MIINHISGNLRTFSINEPPVVKNKCTFTLAHGLVNYMSESSFLPLIRPRLDKCFQSYLWPRLYSRSFSSNPAVFSLMTRTKVYRKIARQARVSFSFISSKIYMTSLQCAFFCLHVCVGVLASRSSYQWLIFGQRWEGSGDANWPYGRGITATGAMEGVNDAAISNSPRRGFVVAIGWAVWLLHFSLSKLTFQMCRYARLCFSGCGDAWHVDYSKELTIVDLICHRK